MLNLILGSLFIHFSFWEKSTGKRYLKTRNISMLLSYYKVGNILVNKTPSVVINEFKIGAVLSHHFLIQNIFLSQLLANNVAIVILEVGNIPVITTLKRSWSFFKFGHSSIQSLFNRKRLFVLTIRKRRCYCHTIRWAIFYLLLPRSFLRLATFWSKMSYCLYYSLLKCRCYCHTIGRKHSIPLLFKRKQLLGLYYGNDEPF